MLRYDLPLTAPAEQLAADETLLDWCEAGRGEELLVFWEPKEPFVVVGYANKVAMEVNAAACKCQGVPVFRRCSGGGAVVQLPGGLSYALILRINADGPTRNITAANEFIMDRNRQAVQAALRAPCQDPAPPLPSNPSAASPCPSPPSMREEKVAAGRERRGSAIHPIDALSQIPGACSAITHGKEHGHRPEMEVAVRGHTDLAIRAPGQPTGPWLKVAGNSQRRRRHFLLFHGTLLLNCDLPRISELLPMPSQEPDYRSHRSHHDFVTNLQCSPEVVRTALAQAWQADVPFGAPPVGEIQRLAREKYASPAWNHKF